MEAHGTKRGAIGGGRQPPSATPQGALEGPQRLGLAGRNQAIARVRKTVKHAERRPRTEQELMSKGG